MKIYKYFLLHNKKLKPWIKYWLYIKSKVKKIVNLFVLPEAGTSQDIIYTINTDDTINLTGTASAHATFIIFKDLTESGIINGETYTLSSSQELPSGFEVRVECYNENSWQRHLLGNVLNQTHQTITATANTTNTTRLRFMLFISSGTTLNIQNMKLELLKG